MDHQTAHENVYCGVVVINAILGGLNLLLITWLSRDRRRADVHKTTQYSKVMRRLDKVQDGQGPSGPSEGDLN